jgi:hypothetical protein
MTFPLLAAEKKSTFFIIVHRFWQRQTKNTRLQRLERILHKIEEILQLGRRRQSPHIYGLGKLVSQIVGHRRQRQKTCRQTMNRAPQGRQQRRPSTGWRLAAYKL